MNEQPPRQRRQNVFNTSAEFEVCPTGADPLAMMVLRAEAECEKRGWGGEREAPLRWFWLYDNGVLPGGMSSIAMGLADLKEPLEMLSPVSLVEALERYMFRVDRSLIGFILVNEGWMVRWHGNDAETRARVMAAAERRQLWQQPDREEIRVAELQLLTGDSCTATRVRGEEPSLWGPMPVGDAGAVPVAMRRLAATLRRRKYNRRG